VSASPPLLIPIGYPPPPASCDAGAFGWLCGCNLPGPARLSHIDHRTGHLQPLLNICCWLPCTVAGAFGWLCGCYPSGLPSSLCLCVSLPNSSFVFGVVFGPAGAFGWLCGCNLSGPAWPLESGGVSIRLPKTWRLLLLVQPVHRTGVCVVLQTHRAMSCHMIPCQAVPQCCAMQ
jgi:hypothetical protein